MKKMTLRLYCCTLFVFHLRQCRLRPISQFLHSTSLVLSHFLFYVRQLCYEIWTSVRPSVTRWYSIKTVEHIVMLSSPHDSPFILVLCTPRSSRNSDGVTPRVADKQRWGIKMWQFSTNNLLYLRNG